MLENLSLWPHQEKAIERVQEYITAFRAGDTNKSALVQMPTGSGKSGVIATLSRCIPGIGLTLILTPRTSLRDQLYRDINGRFFTKIGYLEELPKVVKKISEGRRLVLGDAPQNLAIVMTIQMLVSIASNGDNETFNNLVEHISLLIVDEGHYEPASEWSKVIRERINAPKVIFTATPYRNDFKVFDIDPHQGYILSFAAARNDRYLREVTVVDRQQEVRDSPAAFAQDIVDFYDSTFPNPGDTPPRVIIRCDDSSSIRHLASAFQQLGKSVIGIHESFSNNGGNDWEWKHVPNPEEEDAIFWIHQFKLLEGIDDPRFQLVAIYEKIGSARLLVQQIGRIIRNPLRQENAKGYLLEHWGGFHSQLWNGFVQYDKALEEEGAEAFDLSTGNGILEKLINLQPKVAYVEGRFRSYFDFNSISPEEDIQLPLRVNLFKKNDNFDIVSLTNEIAEDFRKNDRVTHIYQIPEQNTSVILSVKCKGSPYLRSHTFMEADLNVTLIREFAHCICVYDSTGINTAIRNNAGVGHSLEIEKLKRLFSQGNSAKLTMVSLNNSNLGPSAIRSKSITAASIESTIPGFDDYAQICTTAEGYSSDSAGEISGIPDRSVRRYVGFSRGRITQYDAGYKSLSDYLRWLTKLQEVLEDEVPAITVLSRYALEKKTPEQPAPRSILLDLEGIMESYVLAEDDEQLIEIQDACSDVEDGRFNVTANGQEVVVDIDFESDRYRLKSNALDERYICTADDLPKSLVKYFNQTQSFRVLPEDLSSVYIRGQFYNPAMKVGNDFDVNTYELRHCFVIDEIIGQCTSEKGTRAYYENHNDDWDPDSLFGIISRLGFETGVADHFGDPNIMVCDDVGVEIADFVLCNTTTPKVIFIHAKASSGVPVNCSASKMHEVCAQAVKNLGYMAMFNDHKPSKLNSWDDQWVAKVNGGMGTVERRMHIKDNGDNGEAVWKKIRTAINNPMVEKEVWLFLGNVISKNHFEQQLASETPQPHVIQAAYLLHATMSDVAALGAKLRVFCKP